MPCDSGVLPGDGGAAAVLHINGLGLGVQDIALGALNFPDGVSAVLQLLVDIHIPLVVAFVGADGVALGVGKQELHAINPLAGHAVDFVNEGAPGLPVGDLQRGGATVLHPDLMGRIIQLIALGGFQLHHLIPALFRFGQIDNAVGIGGVGANNFPVELADFKLDALDALPGFLVLFDDGQTAHLRVIHGDGLRVAGIDLDRLRFGALVHHITGQGLGFRDDQRTHHAGNADFAVGVGLVEALAGQVAVSSMCIR